METKTNNQQVKFWGKFNLSVYHEKLDNMSLKT